MAASVLSSEGEEVDFQRQLTQLFAGNPILAQTLMGLRYRNSDQPILTAARLDVVMEVIGLIMTKGAKYAVDFLREASSPADIFWNQPAMDVGRKAVEREIAFQQLDKQVVEGVINCKFCSSRKVQFRRSQTRSSDEPMTTFYKCVSCGKNWSE